MNIETLKKHLTIPGAVHHFSTCDSTNDTAKKLAANGAGENTIVIADHQSRGRGRKGRSFFSPQSSGVYMSIILRPKIKPENTLYITVCAAVAVCAAIEKLTDKKPLIKWVNDIYLDNKKICGILTESSLTSLSHPDFCILGIGINLFAPESDFPEDIKDIAGTLFDKKPQGDIKERLIAAVIEEFNKYYKNLTNKEFMESYRRHSNLIGRQVKYNIGSSEIHAQVLDIDNNAHLVVKKQNGEIEKLFAGEVSVKFK